MGQDGHVRQRERESLPQLFDCCRRLVCPDRSAPGPSVGEVELQWMHTVRWPTICRSPQHHEQAKTSVVLSSLAIMVCNQSSEPRLRGRCGHISSMLRGQLDTGLGRCSLA
jgi:hypothetical protein